MLQAIDQMHLKHLEQMAILIDKINAVIVDPKITTNGTNRFPLKNANACGNLL